MDDPFDDEVPQKPSTGTLLKFAGIAITVFALVSLLTAAFFAQDNGAIKSKQLPATGGLIGPVDFKANQVIKVSVRQTVKKEGWSFVTCEILDDEDTYLFGFGNELWYETGYDSDGYWSERESDFSVKLTIPEAGPHFFECTVESGLNSNKTTYQPMPSRFSEPPTPPAPEDYLSPMVVTIRPKSGSSLPHLLAGIFGLLLGGLIYAIGYSQAEREDVYAGII